MFLCSRQPVAVSVRRSGPSLGPPERDILFVFILDENVLLQSRMDLSLFPSDLFRNTTFTTLHITLFKQRCTI